MLLCFPTSQHSLSQWWDTIKLPRCLSASWVQPRGTTTARGGRETRGPGPIPTALHEVSLPNSVPMFTGLSKVSSLQIPVTSSPSSFFKFKGNNSAPCNYTISFDFHIPYFIFVNTLLHSFQIPNLTMEFLYWGPDR